MGAVISRLQLIDRTQLIIGCGTAAVILLYFRIVGKGGEPKFVPIQQKAIHFQQQQECLTSCASYPSLPDLVSENSFVSVKTALTSSKSSCYPAEEYNYFVITQDAEERTAFVGEQPGTSIPTIQATTLFRSSKPNVETQTCHRDFSHGHTAVPSPEVTKRRASNDSTNKNSLATSTQTCHFDTLHDSSRNTIKPETRSDRRPTARIRDNNTFSTNTAQNPQPKFKVVQQTSIKHSSGTKVRRTQLPDEHSSRRGQARNAGELSSIGTQTCHLHQTPLATRREYRENIFATPSITVSTCLPYASLPAIVPDDEGVDRNSFPSSTSTVSSKGQHAVRHIDSISSARTPAVSHHLYQLPEIPVDSLTSTTQTQRSNLATASQTSVICHHHYQLPEIPVDSLTVTATTQTEKPKSAIATQTSVICHHHYELPEIPVDSVTATTQTEKPNSAIGTQTSVLCHHHYSQLTLVATTQTERPFPRKAQGSVVCHHHFREPTGHTHVTPAPLVQELPDSEDEDETPTTPRTESEPAHTAEAQKPLEDSSDSDFEPKIIDSKPSMKVEDLKLFEHEPLPDIESRITERSRNKSRPRRAEPQVDNSGFWMPVKTRPTYKTRPKEKSRNLLIERKPQPDNQ